MRPRYHYAPAVNWLSDPNGLAWQDGEWHMFYQYNPFGEEWGHMSWGHAVSTDLASWQELPVALAEADQTMIFSGSAVIDRNGTAGFGSNAMVAVYTGARTDRALHRALIAGVPSRSSPAIPCLTDRWQTSVIPASSGTNRVVNGSWP